MKSLGLGRLALSGCVVAAMLAGCGGSQPRMGAPGFVARSDGYTEKSSAQSAGRRRTVHYLYVTNHHSRDVSAFAIHASSGALTPA